MRLISSLLVSFALVGYAAPEKAAPEKPAATEEVAAKLPDPVIREGSVNIGGKDIPYRATTGKIQLLDDAGKPRASIFHVSYVRTDVKDATKRPVMFAFNGGPGSSAVWLHIGVLGPAILALPGDGTGAPVPPVR
jgi:carboxypeptidase C (cathepsin A)